jgi:hypothetical protein
MTVDSIDGWFKPKLGFYYFHTGWTDGCTKTKEESESNQSESMNLSRFHGGDGMEFIFDQLRPIFSPLHLNTLFLQTLPSTSRADHLPRLSITFASNAAALSLCSRILV